MKNNLPFVASLPPLCTPDEMRQWDADSGALHVPGQILMENAAQGARRVLSSYVPDLAGKRVALVMGTGNNGGDAAALARLLLDFGAKPTVYHTRALEHLTGDAATHAKIAMKCGVFFQAAHYLPDECDILVDGILGTGFQGPLRDETRYLVDRCNAMRKRFTLALDVPSGLDAFSGEVSPVAIRANATATFAAAKLGLAFPEVREWTGDVVVCYIGTPVAASSATPPSFRLLTGDFLDTLGGCPLAGHKGKYGHVLVVGGAKGLTGAAHISCLAALRAGAGLVTAVAPGASVSDVKGGSAEIMTRAVGGPDQGAWDASAFSDREFADFVARASAIVVGPGMGRGPDAEEFLEALLRARRTRRTVVDADALYHLSRHPDWMTYTRDCVLTPHAVEMRRLSEGFGVDIENRAEMAGELCRRGGCVVIAKGEGTLVASPLPPFLAYCEDVPQLSCGGSGDCLSGVVAAVMAQSAASGASRGQEDSDGLEIENARAAALGVVWHGEAGRLLGEEYPFRGNLAGEIADCLPKVRRRRLPPTLDFRPV